MDYLTFDMKPSKYSNTTFTVFEKKFIKTVSPEVLNNVPSVLLESDNLEELHKLVSKHTEFTSEIQKVPFLNFNFKSPRGIHFSAKGV